MAVSFPEKTFEHWCSTYVLNRYHTKVEVWWPTVGADIEVEDLGSGPGKAFWLELKTSTWDAGRNVHQVSIDLWQLEKYSRQPVPVYYVFPLPPWIAHLDDSPPPTWLGKTVRSSLAFWRSDPKVFFNWTYVVSAWELHQIYLPMIASLRAAGKFRKTSSSIFVNWNPRTKTPRYNRRIAHKPSHVWSWLNFWRLMDQCGSREMPSVLRTGRSNLPPQSTREQLVSELAAPQITDDDATLQDLTDTPNFWVPDFGDDFAPLGTYRNTEFSRAEFNLEGLNPASRGLVTVPLGSLSID